MVFAQTNSSQVNLIHYADAATLAVAALLRGAAPPSSPWFRDAFGPGLPKAPR